METRLSLAPGQNGTKKLLARYGERLVRVRYRYDAARGVRHKTVELIVETIPWNPRRRNARREPEDMVAVRIAFSETALRERIKAAGAIWRPRQRLWEVNWKTVRELGLLDRVVVEDMRYTPIHSLRTHTQISVIAWLPMPIYVFGIPRMPSITR